VRKTPVGFNKRRNGRKVLPEEMGKGTPLKGKSIRVKKKKSEKRGNRANVS